jgi:hypothetical protein
MNARHLAVWVVVPLLGGIVLLYAGLAFSVVWLKFAFDRNFFGLRTSNIVTINECFSWGIVAFAVGALVGCLLRRRPIIAALATGVAGLLTLISLTRFAGLTVWQLLSEYPPQIASSLTFVTAGALLAARMVRPNTSLERTREG